MLPDVRSAGMATIAALAGATALGTFCCVSQHSAPPPTAAETSTADDVKLGGVGVPARASPVRQQDRDGDETSQHLRTTTTSSAAAEAGVDEESGLTFYGPGFAWDDHDPKPLQDAASQMFSLCLKWRAAGETLNAFKLNKLEFILSRQICGAELPGGALSRQHFTTALLVALLDSWVAADVRGPPQADAARRKKVDSLAAQLRAAYALECTAGEGRATQEGWRHSRAGTYLQWLEREMCAAGSQELAVSPLKHVLLHYDRSLLLAGGLWLEFGVAEGATLGLIASHIPSHLADGVVVGSGESSGKCFGFDSFTGLPEPWRPGFVS